MGPETHEARKSSANKNIGNLIGSIVLSLGDIMPISVPSSKSLPNILLYGYSIAMPQTVEFSYKRGKYSLIFTLLMDHQFNGYPDCFQYTCQRSLPDHIEEIAMVVP